MVMVMAMMVMVMVIMMMMVMVMVIMMTMVMAMVIMMTMVMVIMVTMVIAKIIVKSREQMQYFLFLSLIERFLPSLVHRSSRVPVYTHAHPSHLPRMQQGLPHAHQLPQLLSDHNRPVHPLGGRQERMRGLRTRDGRYIAGHQVPPGWVGRFSRSIEQQIGQSCPQRGRLWKCVCVGWSHACDYEVYGDGGAAHDYTLGLRGGGGERGGCEDECLAVL